MLVMTFELMVIMSSTGASRVLVFNHATRKSNSTSHINEFKKDQPTQLPGVFTAHLDQSSWQAGNVVHKYLPEETEGLLRGRMMIVNVGPSILAKATFS